MTNSPENLSPHLEPQAPTRRLPRWRDPGTITAVVTVTLPIVAIAAAWFMMQQLAAIVRPFFVAVFLAYVLMPYHSRLRKHIGAPASIAVLASATTLALLALALIVYASILGLSDQLPQLQSRAGSLIREVETLVGQTAPWSQDPQANAGATNAKLTEHLTRAASSAIAVAVEVLLEVGVVVLYLLFLLLEGSRFPDRVRRAYPPERAEAILDIAGQVSSAIVSYLRAKVKSSLVLALPVTLVLWALGVKFALLWGILTFLCNFIPYIGSVIAYTFPVGFAFLLFGVRWEPVAVAALLLMCHVGSASVVEPLIIGNAVGLSPLVILASLAFWGLLWGMPGMFLAVPLTVVAVIVIDHFDATRSTARLLRGG
jgi:AI-2 transport protein TqsA